MFVFFQRFEIMTNNEIKETLQDANRILGSMDKNHVRNILKILIDAQVKKSCASFLSLDIRKTTKKLLVDLIKSDHVNNYLTRKHMKQIYEILGDYHIYPICKLCGQPIKIDSFSVKHETQSQQMSFSWDHIKPKSLGRSYDLANMQPTHKICNNKRGIKPIYRQIGSNNSHNNKLKLNIKIDIFFDLEPDNHKYRPDRFGLRKQDAWCHKQCCQYCY